MCGIMASYSICVVAAGNASHWEQLLVLTLKAEFESNLSLVVFTLGGTAAVVNLVASALIVIRCRVRMRVRLLQAW